LERSGLFAFAGWLALCFHEGLRENNGQLCSGLAKSVTEKNNEGKGARGFAKRSYPVENLASGVRIYTNFI